MMNKGQSVCGLNVHFERKESKYATIFMDLRSIEVRPVEREPGNRDIKPSQFSPCRPYRAIQFSVSLSLTLSLKNDDITILAHDIMECSVFSVQTTEPSLKRSK